MSVVTTEQRGLVSIIRINRPEKMNAISSAVAVELQQAFEAFDASDQRVAILSSVGERAFTAGADVTDLPELWRTIPTVGFNTDKPIIAATSGWCIGGGIVMVMMCDLMVSTESTVFYYPEAKLGVTGGMISNIKVKLENNRLQVEVRNNSGPIDPIKNKKDVFQSADGSTVTFMRNEKGDVTRVVMKALGISFEGTKQ